ncbi:MAG: hypothetical protein ACRC8T_06470 [Acidaminococcaceae bacterium]
MKKMKSALLIGTLVAALGASTVFAATSGDTSDYEQNPHKMRNLVQQAMQEKNAGDAGASNYPEHNKHQHQGPGTGVCTGQGQMHKGSAAQHMGPDGHKQSCTDKGMHEGHGIMREQGAKILADLTGRDVESIKEEAHNNHKPMHEIAKDAGVYDQFMAKHLELAKDHLAKAVADGKITQEQADQMLQNMKDGKHFGPKNGMHKNMMQGQHNGSCPNNKG